MSKKYSRDENSLERLEKENRELKSQVRSLSSRLKKLTRGYYKFLDEENQDEKEVIIEKAFKEAEKVCWACRIGKLHKVDLGFRYFRQCNNCEYRTKSKPTQSTKKVK